ncbi:MAG: cobalt ECF transporter T component CbiQ [Dehalococcoidales bacterium]|nr:cobalt ECF transporter T component CbiQ [Dehalococcoidales bacterium]
MVNHNLIDQYSERDSFTHRLDPRTKFIITLLFISLVVLTPPDTWLAFSSYFVFSAILLLFSRVPIGYVFKRSLAIMPFVLMIAIFIPFFKEGEIAGSYNIGLWRLTVTYSGLQILTNIAIKAWLSILSLIWLTSTTRLPQLLHALRQLHFPQIVVMILSFMYRYLFILIDELARMNRARDSRNFGGKWLWQIRTIGNMIGTLFIRSYEMGERAYMAMAARGFDGQIRTLNRLSFSPSDTYFGISCGIILVLIGLFSLFN